MRVLMVTPSFFPAMGGIETHVSEVGRRLARAGVAVTVLTTDRTGALAVTETLEDMQIIRVPAFPTQRDWYYAPAMRDVIMRKEWDLMHCQGCHTLVPPLAMRAARHAMIPYAVTFHTGGHSSRWRNSIRGMQWRAQRSLLAGARQLIGVSPFEARMFQHVLRLPEDRFTVIPNGGELAMPPGAVAQSPDPLIVSVGRLERYKGHQRVIAALPEVLRHRPATRLEILGSGPYEAPLRRLAERLGIAERVRIRAIRPADRAEMATALAQAHLIVLLSDYEAHPVAVMEALALRRPVLVSDTSGLRDLAERGWVRSIPQGSAPAATGQAILAMLADPLIPSDVRLPTWDDCAEAVLKVYHKIAEIPSCAL
jgi:glycogen synthase